MAEVPGLAARPRPRLELPGPRKACPAKIWDPVFAWMLWILHVLVEVFSLAHEFYQRAYRLAFPRNYTLKKLPKNIGFAIDSRLTASLHISHVLHFCVQHNIRRISLYDMEGELASRHESIAREFSTSHDGTVTVRVGEKEYRAVRGDVDLKTVENEDNFDDKNGVQLEFLSAQLGEEVMSDALKRYCKEQWPKERKANFNLKGQHLNKGCKLVPDLIISIGKHFSLKGFPAWLIRTAELGHIKTIYDVNSDLSRALEVYDKSIQRHGA